MIGPLDRWRVECSPVLRELRREPLVFLPNGATRGCVRCGRGWDARGAEAVKVLGGLAHVGCAADSEALAMKDGV